MKPLAYHDLNVPASVYRLQLNAHFPLKAARKILPYLKHLGIEAVYCSPCFKAYSPHGYDITDSNLLNPALGTLEEYKQFCTELKKLGLFHIADIVPNHMGMKGGQNLWWQDVLENGPYSEYASYFDINWSPEKRELQNKVLLPILGSSYGKILENEEIKLTYAEGEFALHYSDYTFPVCAQSYPMILENEIKNLKSKYTEEDEEFLAYQELIEIYRFFPVASRERKTIKKKAKEKLRLLFIQSSKLSRHILNQIAQFNRKKHKEHALFLLHKLLDAQFYRLAYWRVARHEINYRRFFNINELVSMHIEDEKVFESYHRLLFELIKTNCIQGLRIDHSDGLFEPYVYFQRLRKKNLLFTVTEKILGKKEKLPENWEIEGTVGYDYLNVLNGVFIEQKHEKALTSTYEAFIGKKLDFHEVVYDSKKIFTTREMVSEVKALGLKLDQLSESSWVYRDFTQNELTIALSEIIACFPVYRTYLSLEDEVSKRDEHLIKIAIEKAKNKVRFLDASIFEFIELVLLGKAKILPEEERAYREFVLRFQQITAPIMAKGLEDTAFYIYNNFLSLNEVGGDPSHFGSSPGEFHAYNLEKKEKWPYGFLATSTHDTKRSEDVRMRLNVLSEMPEKWNFEVKKWSLLTHKFKSDVISANTEYFIYQTLIGIWPKKLKKVENAQFCERIWQIILKSLREARQQTSWVFPNSNYEEAVRKFFMAIVSPGKTNHFLKSFINFHKIIDRCGAWSSLSLVTLKMASPGVVDIYQGNEILNYKLIDPDNRANIDFDHLKKTAESILKAKADHLFNKNDLSNLKFFIQEKALHFRSKNKELFLDGDYIPLKCGGVRKENIIAFLRKKEGKICIAVVGRFFSVLVASEWDAPLGRHIWGDTEILIPSSIRFLELIDLFTKTKIRAKRKGNLLSLPVAEIFNKLPVSLLSSF